jgi:hypothetical protein
MNNHSFLLISIDIENIIIIIKKMEELHKNKKNTSPNYNKYIINNLNFNPIKINTRKNKV